MILGNDFLQKYKLVLDFTSTPVSVTSKPVDGLETLPKGMKPIVDTSKKAKICAVQAFEETAGETIDSCAILLFGKAHHLSLMSLVLIQYYWQYYRTAQEVV